MFCIMQLNVHLNAYAISACGLNVSQKLKWFKKISHGIPFTSWAEALLLLLLLDVLLLSRLAGLEAKWKLGNKNEQRPLYL